MKKLNLIFGMLAVILSGTLVFAGTSVPRSGTLYGKINGVWTNIENRDPSSYDCDGQTNECTARFLSAPNPQGTNYVSGSLTQGIFVE